MHTVLHIHKSDTIGTDPLFLSLGTTVKLFQLLAKVSAVKMANLNTCHCTANANLADFLLFGQPQLPSP